MTYRFHCRAAAFALGLATTLALLGVVSSSVGNAYGQIGDALPLGKYILLASQPNTFVEQALLLLCLTLLPLDSMRVHCDIVTPPVAWLHPTVKTRP